jgi:hypothetical protein
VSIYASTDSAQAKALLDAFSAKYPGIKIEYNDRGTNGAYDRVISEAAARQVGADIIEQPEIMLAHFSTAPAAAAVRDVIRAPVLTSPEAAVAKLRRLIVPS